MKKKVIAIFKYCYRLIKHLEHEESVIPQRASPKKVMPKIQQIHIHSPSRLKELKIR
jgi:hypothetical protein